MAEKRNVLRYLLWRGDLTCEADPINPVDALIFSILSYANLDFVNRQSDPGRKYTIAMLPEELKRTEREEGNYGPKQFAASVKKLIQMAADSKRFRDVTIRCFQSILNDEVQMQFAAAAFELPGQAVFLAFRGTDASLVGWKEDLNMSFTDGIPSQIAARLFAEQVITEKDRHLFLGGHSKGGNLAVWAATNLEEEKKRRLEGVYNNDGPGFSEEFLRSPQYLAIRDKVYSYVPESSIVGILMEHDEYTTIRSTNPSIFQHDPFSWCVTGNQFDDAKKRTVIGQQMDHSINSWIKSLTREEREQFVDSIWTVVSASNARTLDELNASKIKSVLSMQKAFATMEPDKQKQLLACASKLLFGTNSKQDQEDDTGFDW